MITQGDIIRIARDLGITEDEGYKYGHDFWVRGANGPRLTIWRMPETPSGSWDYKVEDPFAGPTQSFTPSSEGDVVKFLCSTLKVALPEGV